MFHSGWFVESLATQTLVLFVIRTMGNPFRSRPSRALTITTLAITAVGVSLPWTPLAGALGFSALPAAYVVFLLAASAAYLALVEVAKRRWSFAATLQQSIDRVLNASLLRARHNRRSSRSSSHGKHGLVRNTSHPRSPRRSRSVLPAPRGQHDDWDCLRAFVVLQRGISSMPLISSCRRSR